MSAHAQPPTPNGQGQIEVDANEVVARYQQRVGALVGELVMKDVEIDMLRGELRRLTEAGKD